MNINRDKALKVLIAVFSAAIVCYSANWIAISYFGVVRVWAIKRAMLSPPPVIIASVALVFLAVSRVLKSKGALVASIVLSAASPFTAWLYFKSSGNYINMLGYALMYSIPPAAVMWAIICVFAWPFEYIKKSLDASAERRANADLVRAKAREVERQSRFITVAGRSALAIDTESGEKSWHNAPHKTKEIEADEHGKYESIHGHGEKRPYVIRKKLDIEDIKEHLPGCPSVIEAFKGQGIKIRMMMLGASGSGKTVTMAMLMILFGSDPRIKYVWITPKGPRELFFPSNVNVEVRGGGESKEHVIDAKNALIEAIEIGKIRGGLSRDALRREEFIIVGVDEIKKFGLLFERYFGKGAKEEFTGLWLDLACFGRSQNLAIWIINQSGTVKDLGLEGSGQNRDNFNITMRQTWDFLDDIRYCVIESPGRYPTMYRAPTEKEAMELGIDCSTDPPTYVGGTRGTRGTRSFSVHKRGENVGYEPHVPPCTPCTSVRPMIPMKEIDNNEYQRDTLIMGALRAGVNSLNEIVRRSGLSLCGNNSKMVQSRLKRYGVDIEYDEYGNTEFKPNGQWRE